MFLSKYPILKWLLLSTIVGIAAGSASAIFLHGLNWVSQFRMSHPSIIWGLPLVGLFMGWSYYKFGANAGLGNHLVISEANERKDRIPLRMAPMVLVGTWLTHLFGGSAGREGTAIQMGASLSDTIKRVLCLPKEDHRLIIMAGISGGFGSVFGVPMAGFIFGLEVQKIGRLRYNAVIPCLTSSIIGDYTAHLLQAPHGIYPQIAQYSLDLILLLKTILAAICFGLFSWLFIETIKVFKLNLNKLTQKKWLHPFIGGIVVIVLSYLFGKEYLGLSLGLIELSMNSQLDIWVAPIKLLFTSVTLASGFLGGEVTPLFVIGSTLGNSLSPILNLDPIFLASIGLVAVFAGCSNTPLACTIMGIELFGSGNALYILIACFVAFIVSGHRGIYTTQKLWIDKKTPYGLPTSQKISDV